MYGRFVFKAVLLVLAFGVTWGQEVQNLAAPANGGHIVFFSSQFDDSTWKVDNLLAEASDNGWAGASSGPQSVVIGFRNNGLARIEDILINPYTRENPATWAKEVEIQISTTYPFRDFRTAGKLTLSNQGRPQLFSLPEPTEARYVKFRFLSNYGGGYMEAGEIQVMGRIAGAAPAPAYSNVAAAAAGARIESYTSQFDDSGWAVANLLEADGGGQWAGTSSGSQEVVIALPATTEVSAVSVDNYARETPSNWAKDVEIEISPEYAYKGFVPVGKMNLPPIGDLHTLVLDSPVRAKYVRVFFRSNHGGGYMEANRIRVFHTPDAIPSAQPRPTQSLEQQLRETGQAVVHEIHFATNSAQILPDSEETLRQIATVLEQNPRMELIIEGHTDNLGGDDFNLDLSRRRAEAVKHWLVDRSGIAELRLTTAGYGLTRPLADNSTEAGRAQNRRVELRVRK